MDEVPLQASRCSSPQQVSRGLSSHPVLVLLQGGGGAPGYLADPQPPTVGGAGGATVGGAGGATAGGAFRTSQLHRPTTTSPQCDARGQAPPPGELGPHRGAGAAPGAHGGHHHRGHGPAAPRPARAAAWGNRTQAGLSPSAWSPCVCLSAGSRVTIGCAGRQRGQGSRDRGMEAFVSEYWMCFCPNLCYRNPSQLIWPQVTTSANQPSFDVYSLFSIFLYCYFTFLGMCFNHITLGKERGVALLCIYCRIRIRNTLVQHR